MPSLSQRVRELLLPDGPEGLVTALGAWLEHLRVHNYSQATVKNRHVYVSHLIVWLKEALMTESWVANGPEAVGKGQPI